MESPPRISVLLPLQDERDAGIECVRAWTERQTAAAESFEVVALALGANRRLERAVHSLLRDHDRWIEIPGVDEYEAFNVGAEAARGEFIFLTEAHCVPEHDALASMLEELERTGASGIRGATTPVPTGRFGALELEAVEQSELAEEDPEHWRKVLIHSFAIRRDLYIDAGGLRSDRYGEFAPWALSIELDSRGERPEYNPRPRVRHVYDGDLETLRAFVPSFTRGESRYRGDHPTDSTDRYLGWSSEWESSLEHTRAGAIRALGAGFALRHRGALKSMSRHAAVAVLGRHVAIAMARWRAEFAALRARLTRDPERRRRTFNEFWLQASRRGRLEGLGDAPDRLGAQPPPLQWIDLTESQRGRAVGLHQPEDVTAEQPFRWTKPLSLLRVVVPGAGRMRGKLELRPFQRPEWAAARRPRLAVDNRVVSIRVTEGGIEFDIDPGEHWIALACSPLRPRRHGVDDSRTLGLPVRSLSFEPAPSGAGR